MLHSFCFQSDRFLAVRSLVALHLHRFLLVLMLPWSLSCCHSGFAAHIDHSLAFLDFLSVGRSLAARFLLFLVVSLYFLNCSACCRIHQNFPHLSAQSSEREKLTKVFFLVFCPSLLTREADKMSCRSQRTLRVLSFRRLAWSCPS